MKTKHTSHTLVDNYTNFLNKLLDLPKTPRSEKIKAALFRFRSTANYSFIYKKFADVFFEHLTTKKEGLLIDTLIDFWQMLIRSRLKR